jgi:hypothetical protein
LLQGLSTPEIRNSSTKLTLVNLIIAIGAQCSKTELTTVQAESFFFACGQQQAFAGMLEDPNLDMVRAFLLMSFYLLGSMPPKCSVHVFERCYSSCRGTWSLQQRLICLAYSGSTFKPVRTSISRAQSSLLTRAFLQNTNVATSLCPGSAICVINS